MDYLITMDTGDQFLAHHGVKGMKWGKWNAETASRYSGGNGERNKPSLRTRHLAKKDAKEFSRAKMYYGEGAGNRRKLIKNTVEQRKKDRNGYAESFEKYLNETNWEKTVKTAKKQRVRNTTVKKAAKTGRGIVHALNGNPMYASAAALSVVGGYKILKATGGDKVVVEKGKNAVGRIRSSVMLGKMIWNNRRR